MYVAVKGGERAIDNAHEWLAEERRGDTAVPELSLEQIEQQLSHAVDRAMTEGSLYDRELAALAIKQARGDVIEAVFLLRAFRTTLPRFGYSKPLGTSKMGLKRRISATFKDIPGGQILGPTFDYTHRLLDFELGEAQARATGKEDEHGLDQQIPQVVDLLNADGLIEQEPPADDDAPVGDVTRESMSFPVDRDTRLQILARGDEGFLLSLGYSSQRGYGNNHPFVGELRLGDVTVEFEPEELGFPIELGEVCVTECQMINQFKGSKTVPAQFTRGYGLGFGHCERKVMSMALVDRCLRGRELGENIDTPARDEEFVLYHADNVQATGFVEHLKLPHYVDFQSELVTVRRLREESAGSDTAEEKAS